MSSDESSMEESGGVQIPADDEEEPSLQDAMSRFLTNESFHDLKLQGTDGGLVSVNRHALAARSPVFEKMLLGRFREGSSDTVELPYPVEIINAIVEYIHKDTAAILETRVQSIEKASKQICALASLADASNYFELPGLCRKVCQTIEVVLARFPEAAFPLFEACCGEKGVAKPK